MDQGVTASQVQICVMRSLAMQPTYKVGRITARQVERAYLLVNRIAPTLDLDAWRASCGEVLSRKDRQTNQDDIIVATNPLGYVQGLCIIAVRQHIVYGRILDVSFLVVASAADEAGVASDLLLHLKALARSDACEGIRIWTPGREDWSQSPDKRELDRSSPGMLIVLHSSSLGGG